MNRKDLFSNLPTFGAKKAGAVPKPAKAVKVAQIKPQAFRKQKIAPMSVKRKEEMKQYLREVKVWKVGKMCAVFPNMKCVDCHHIKGREGKMLLNQKFWLPVSRQGHDFINANPDEARVKGWIINRGQK